MSRRIRVAWAALALVAACTGAETVADAPAPAIAQPFAPGAISDARWQWRLTFTPDGDTAWYAVSADFFPASRRATIMRSLRGADGAWSTPEVASFSGRWPDMDPFVTRDGRRMYFTSIRPDENGAARADLDLFVMDRLGDGGWSEPRRLGDEVNSAQDELYPSLSAAGTLYFASGPFGPGPDADWNLFVAEVRGGGFAPRQSLDRLNTDLPFSADDPTADWEFNPEISADGRTLLFTSLRPGGHGFGDLYVATRDGNGWSVPRNLGAAVNTADDEFHPTLSADGSALYFARTRFGAEPGASDFWVVATESVEALQ